MFAYVASSACDIGGGRNRSRAHPHRIGGFPGHALRLGTLPQSEADFFTPMSRLAKGGIAAK